MMNQLEEHGCEYWVDCGLYDRMRCQCLHDICKVRERLSIEAKKIEGAEQ